MNSQIKPINFPAVRAANRAWDVMFAAFADAAAADAGFDGGEWSCGFHDRAAHAAASHIADRVAARFDLTSDELLDHVHRAVNHQLDLELRARSYERRALKR
jgi:hypothetical protein